MSIETIYGDKKLFTCDNCGNGVELDSWGACQVYMWDNGWIIRRENGEWAHYCPECQEGEE